MEPAGYVMRLYVIILYVVVALKCNVGVATRCGMRCEPQENDMLVGNKLPNEGDKHSIRTLALIQPNKINGKDSDCFYFLFFMGLT